MTDLNPVDAMTNPYRALCSELVEQVQRAINDHGLCLEASDALMHRARALLDQQGPEKPTDEEMLRIMAAGIRYGYTAGHNDTVEARYGDPDDVAADFAPEILKEMGAALAHCGRPTPQPVPEPVAPTDEEIMELMPQQMRDDLAQAARAMTGPELLKASAVCRVILNRHAVDHARAVLDKWGNSQGVLDSSPQPVAVSERLPAAEDCDAEGRCWLCGEQLAPGTPTWVLGFPAWAKRFPEVHRFWLPAHALPGAVEAQK